MGFKEWEEEPPAITPEISAWLSGSVVTQPVFHGTNKRFDQFQKMDNEKALKESYKLKD